MGVTGAVQVLHRPGGRDVVHIANSNRVITWSIVRVWILPSMQVMAAPNRPSEVITSFWPPWRQTAADVALHCPAMDLIWIVVIAVLVILVFVFVGIYNGLVQSRNRVDNSWAQVDVQLKRRYDLIPNLVETVKGYASHERETFERVTQARSAAQAATGPAEQAQAEGFLTQALRQLFAVAEAYPELRASENSRICRTS